MGSCGRFLTFEGLFLLSSGLLSEFQGEIFNFFGQPPVLCFPRSVVRLDFRLELVQRFVCRGRILEESPIIAQKEMIEELVSDVKIWVLNVSSST
jgi:hypothetical protein